MNQSRPRIGLSMDVGTPDETRRVYELNADYANALLEAGALPVPLPHTGDQVLRREMIASVDGLLIPGGADIDPALYGQPQHPKTHLMDSQRQAFDLALLGWAEEFDLPTLGICLGCQLMNVQRGGSLHQSIADVFPDSPVRHAAIKEGNTYHSSTHDISLRPGTHLAGIFQAADIPANSRHRQAVADLGHGLIATGFAPDGILESLEDLHKTFWIGVQWHPENLSGTIHARLFAALAEAARDFARTRRSTYV
jgi:putative glutamine amidotransferase